MISCRLLQADVIEPVVKVLRIGIHSGLVLESALADDDFLQPAQRVSLGRKDQIMITDPMQPSMA